MSRADNSAPKSASLVALVAALVDLMNWKALIALVALMALVDQVALMVLIPTTVFHHWQTFFFSTKNLADLDGTPL